MAQVKKRSPRTDTRAGRGFSLSELDAVNLSRKGAKKLGLYVDLRRDTKSDHNIDALKKWTARRPRRHATSK